MRIAMDDVFLFFLITSLVGVVYYFPRDKRKRNTLVLVSILSFILFGIANERENEKHNQVVIEDNYTDYVEKKEHKKEMHQKKKAELKKDSVYETFQFNQEIENNDEVKVQLLTIEKLENEVMGRDKIEAIFEIKNKTDRLMQVRGQAVSINNRMINNSLYLLREEISSGKTAVSTLTIEDYQDQNELPNLEENFEMTLQLFDWDDFDYESLVDVNVKFE